MIDYNYYTQLNDKDLEKISSHIKNIQNQRQNEFENSFFNADIEKVSHILPHLNKDKLENIFYSYIDKFYGSEKHVNFYIFLKTNEFTKHFEFDRLEKKICYKFANVQILEIIKKNLPETFNSFKNNSFRYDSFQDISEELISYLHTNDFIDFQSIKKTKNISNQIICYMLDHNMFETFKNFPLSTWFSYMKQDTLVKVRQHFNLSPLNFDHIYSSASLLDMKEYMNISLKYNSPEFLENFTITPFFVIQVSKAIDNVTDEVQPVNFLVKLYSLIQKEDISLQKNLITILKSEIKNPQNKEILKKIDLNFTLHQKLPEKNIKHSSYKI